MVHNDLTKGNITDKLTKVALPIMGTSFLQMAYNIVDMIWIGKIGSDSVAAVGSAGYFMWLSFSLVTLAGVGSEVNIAKNLGAKNIKKANTFAKTSVVFALTLGLLYALFIAVFNVQLISFFRLGDADVEALATQYLSIVAIGMPFAFINPNMSGMYNAAGVSKIPFRINSMGLIMNIVLDPVLIFVFGLGVKGAAIATVASQITVSLLFVRLFMGETRPYQGFDFRQKFSVDALKAMVKISLPVSLQNGLFTIIAIFVARIVAGFGTTAIAVQKVGSQVEAISYMTAHGFGAALSAFTGQNIGAGHIDRVKKGFKSAGLIIGVIGIATSMILFFGAEYIFKVFISEEPALSMGITYLRIISFSQFFMCVEITMAGGFNGLGKSLPPAIISVGFNALRIPGAFLLSAYTFLELNGVWWAITISSVLKGSILVLVLVIVLKRLGKTPLKLYKKGVKN